MDDYTIKEITVAPSTGGRYRLNDQEKQRIRDYRAKYADLAAHERFYANMRIETAILNGMEVEDE